MVSSDTAMMASAISKAVRLHPGRQIVAAAQLLAFPGPKRFERMRGHDQRDAVADLGQDAAKVRVPGVAVDDVGIDRVGQRHHVGLQRFQGALQLLVHAGVKLSPPKG